MNAITETKFNFPKQKNFYKGKVRDVYNIDDKQLVMVVSDRISAFDVVLPEGIPYKGQVLNQIAAKFLKATEDIVPNWVIAVPDPMVTVGLFCEPFKVELAPEIYHFLSFLLALQHHIHFFYQNYTLSKHGQINTLE